MSGAGQDLFVIHMRQGAAGEDEVLIDPHSMSTDHSVSPRSCSVRGCAKAAAIARTMAEGGTRSVGRTKPSRQMSSSITMTAMRTMQSQKIDRVVLAKRIVK